MKSIYCKYSTTSWLWYSRIRLPCISYRVIEIQSLRDFALFDIKSSKFKFELYERYLEKTKYKNY